MTNDNVPVTPEGTVKASKKQSFVVDLFIRLVREKPLGTVGAVIVLLLLIAGVFPDFLAPYGMNEGILANRLSPPSGAHLLGTDNLGRDILSRIMYGARISVIIGLSATAIATLMSTIIGGVSGFIGGKLDTVVQRFVDAWLCLPPLLILITVMSIVGRGVPQIIVVLDLEIGISNSRIVRSATITIKENIYVEAAKSIGCPTTRILIRHILPNIMAPIIISFTTTVGRVILIEAALSFLGFGLPPGIASWGSMLSLEGRKYMELRPELSLWPGLALSIVVYGTNMFGDAMRDLLDPRLKDR